MDDDSNVEAFAKEIQFILDFIIDDECANQVAPNQLPAFRAKVVTGGPSI